MQEVSNPGHLMWDPFAGMHSISKLALWLGQHARFIRCGKDDSCLQKLILSPVEFYAYYLPAERSDLTGDEQLKDSAFVYMLQRNVEG